MDESMKGKPDSYWNEKIRIAEGGIPRRQEEMEEEELKEALLKEHKARGEEDDSSLDGKNSGTNMWRLPSHYYHLAALLYGVEEANYMLRMAVKASKDKSYGHFSSSMKARFRKYRMNGLAKTMEKLSDEQYLLICSFLYRAFDIIGEDLPSVSGEL